MRLVVQVCVCVKTWCVAYDVPAGGGTLSGLRSSFHLVVRCLLRDFFLLFCVRWCVLLIEGTVVEELSVLHSPFHLIMCCLLCDFFFLFCVRQRTLFILSGRWWRNSVSFAFFSPVHYLLLFL